MAKRKRRNLTLRIRTATLRERLLRRGWGLRGAWAEKTHRGVKVVLSGGNKEQGEWGFYLLSFHPEVSGGTTRRNPKTSSVAPGPTEPPTPVAPAAPAPPRVAESPDETPTPTHFDVAELKVRGWTETLVQKLLGEAGTWGAVNHWQNYTGKRLYRIDRVTAVESTPEFQAAAALAARRSAAQLARKGPRRLP